MVLSSLVVVDGFWFSFFLKGCCWLTDGCDQQGETDVAVLKLPGLGHRGMGDKRRASRTESELTFRNPRPLPSPAMGCMADVPTDTLP